MTTRRGTMQLTIVNTSADRNAEIEVTEERSDRRWRHHMTAGSKLHLPVGTGEVFSVLVRAPDNTDRRPEPLTTEDGRPAGPK